MHRRFYIVGLVLFSMVIALAMTLARTNSLRKTAETRTPPPTSSPQARPSVERGNYRVVRAKIENERKALWSRYQQATNALEKETIINQGRETLLRSAHDEIFPYWYGTTWDFYGTTETPGEGRIACGYFVSTVLRDLGLKVERAKLAQQASEKIVLSLTSNDHTKRFRQVPIDSFIGAIKNWGPGLYVVGLDVHVGFILNDGGNVYFIHSSYVDPYCVVKERGIDSTILTGSRYRVLAKLSEDDDLILKWFRGDQFITHV